VRACDTPGDMERTTVGGGRAGGPMSRISGFVGESRWVSAALTAAWVVWSIVLGTGDKQRVVGLPPDASEPVEHVVTFLVLGALVMMTVRRRPVVVFVALVAAGLIGELIQLGVAGRTFSLGDLGMDAIGAGLGVVASRRSIPWTRIATYGITVALIVSTPVVLTDSETPPITVFAEDCTSAPPPSDRDPEIILEVDELEDAELPRVVDRPRVNQIRHRLMQTDELTVETWFETSDLSQHGPARVFTISRGPTTTRMNLHVGVSDDDVSIRLRNSCDIFNWIQIDDVLEVDRPHHVVFTWAGGLLSTWVDGVVVGRDELPWGDFDRWNVNYATVIGAEFGGGRAFDGTIYSVTMWDGALSDDEIVRRSTLVPG
jgi:VanZ family protein